MLLGGDTAGSIWGSEGVGMFLNPGLGAIDEVLKRDNVRVEDLLDEDEVLQEMKALNPQLVEFLSEPSSIEALLDYTTLGHRQGGEHQLMQRESSSSALSSTESGDETTAAATTGAAATAAAADGPNGEPPTAVPVPGTAAAESKQSDHQASSARIPDTESDSIPTATPVVDPQLALKYSYMACEVLCCDVSAITNRILGDNALLGRLFDILDRDAPLDARLAGYFHKVLVVLVQRNADTVLRFVTFPNGAGGADEAVAEDAPSAEVAAGAGHMHRGVGLVPKFLRHIDSYSITCSFLLLVAAAEQSLQDLNSNTFYADAAAEAAAAAEGGLAALHRAHRVWSGDEGTAWCVLEALKGSTNSDSHANAAEILSDMFHRCALAKRTAAQQAQAKTLAGASEQDRLGPTEGREKSPVTVAADASGAAGTGERLDSDDGSTSEDEELEAVVPGSAVSPTPIRPSPSLSESSFVANTMENVPPPLHTQSTGSDWTREVCEELLSVALSPPTIPEGSEALELEADAGCSAANAGLRVLIQLVLAFSAGAGMTMHASGRVRPPCAEEVTSDESAGTTGVEEKLAGMTLEEQADDDDELQPARKRNPNASAQPAAESAQQATPPPPPPLNGEPGTPEGAVRVACLCPPPRELAPVLKALPQLCTCLRDGSQGMAPELTMLHTQWGGEIQRLGMRRLLIAELFGTLIQSQIPAVVKAVADCTENALGACLDLFFEFEWNNLLHGVVERMLHVVIAAGGDLSLALQQQHDPSANLVGDAGEMGGFGMGSQASSPTMNAIGDGAGGDALEEEHKAKERAVENMRRALRAVHLPLQRVLFGPQCNLLDRLVEACRVNDAAVEASEELYTGLRAAAASSTADPAAEQDLKTSIARHGQKGYMGHVYRIALDIDAAIKSQEALLEARAPPLDATDVAEPLDLLPVAAAARTNEGWKELVEYDLAQINAIVGRPLGGDRPQQVSSFLDKMGSDFLSVEELDRDIALRQLEGLREGDLGSADSDEEDDDDEEDDEDSSDEGDAERGRAGDAVEEKLDVPGDEVAWFPDFPDDVDVAASGDGVPLATDAFPGFGFGDGDSPADDAEENSSGAGR